MIARKIEVEEFLHSQALMKKAIIDVYGELDSHWLCSTPDWSSSMYLVYKFPKEDFSIMGQASPLIEYVVFKIKPKFSNKKGHYDQYTVYMFEEHEIKKFTKKVRHFRNKEEKLINL